MGMKGGDHREVWGNGEEIIGRYGVMGRRS